MDGEKGAISPPQYEVSHRDKLWKKSKEAPFVPIGVAAMIGTVIYGAYSYKNRGKMSTSVYLMHLRVRAQGMVVGAITLGVGYSLLRDIFFPSKIENNTPQD